MATSVADKYEIEPPSKNQYEVEAPAPRTDVMQIPDANAQARAAIRRPIDAASRDTLDSQIGDVRHNTGKSISEGLHDIDTTLTKKRDAAEVQNIGGGHAHPGVYDAGARLARVGAGATSPAGVATAAGMVLAPEIVGPALVAHGGLQVLEHGKKAMRGNPEDAEAAIGGAAEMVGGAAGTGAGLKKPTPFSNAVKSMQPELSRIVRDPATGKVRSPWEIAVDKVIPDANAPTSTPARAIPKGTKYGQYLEDRNSAFKENQSLDKKAAAAEKSTDVPVPRNQVIKLPAPNESVGRLRPLTPESAPGSDILDIARQGDPRGGPELSRRARKILYVGEDGPGPSARLARADNAAEVPQPIAKPVAKNGSGESGASQEAINRVAANKSNGTQRFRVTGSGQEIPLHGVDAVDAHPGAAEHIVEKGPNGTQIVESGAKAQPYTAKPQRAPDPYQGIERRKSSAHDREIFNQMLKDNPEGQQLERSMRERRAGATGDESEGPARQAIMSNRDDYVKFRTAELNGDTATTRAMLMKAKQNLAKPPKPAGK